MQFSHHKISNITDTIIADKMERSVFILVKLWIFVCKIRPKEFQAVQSSVNCKSENNMFNIVGAPVEFEILAGQLSIVNCEKQKKGKLIR